MPICTILPLFFTAAQKHARIGHGVRGRLFHVGIAARVHRLGAVIRVLEVGGGNDHRVHILARIQLVVVAHLVGTVSAQLLDESRRLPRGGGFQMSDTATIWKFMSLAFCWNAGRSPCLHAIAAAHDADMHAIVRARDRA